jgi:hypothetical protein
MGREIRMVPADWQHPRDEVGRLKPLHDGFNKNLADWNEGNDKWRQGFISRWTPSGYEWEPRGDTCKTCKSYADWAGDQPKSDDYMPDWPASERTHLMMYETTSEGTPLSPACATPEELARWLADNGASAFGRETATYDQWLTMCRRGWAPSAVMSARGLESGVAALSLTPERSKGGEP